jgi:universal stress protein A
VFEHILLATDLTDVSAEAQEKAAALAVAFEARLTVVHVCEPPAFAVAGASVTGSDLVGPSGDGARAELDRIVWRLRGRTIRADGVLRFGVPWEHVVAVAREVGADLIVTGTHGRHGVAHALHGSVAEKLVQESGIPVLAVPHRAGGDQAG